MKMYLDMKKKCKTRVDLSMSGIIERWKYKVTLNE